MNPQDPDDAAVGYEQARLLKATLTAAGIDRGQLWLYYFSIGGAVSKFEVDAYLHHAMTLPRLQRDLLAQATNEILADIAPPRAPFAAEVKFPSSADPGASARDGGPKHGDPDGGSEGTGGQRRGAHESRRPDEIKRHTLSYTRSLGTTKKSFWSLVSPDTKIIDRSSHRPSRTLS